MEGVGGRRGGEDIYEWRFRLRLMNVVRVGRNCPKASNGRMIAIVSGDGSSCAVCGD